LHVKEWGYNPYMHANGGETPKPQKVLSDIRTKPSSYWKQLRKKNMLSLFKSAASRVPAYADFLKKNQIHADSITAYKELSNIPPTNKANYLRAYPMEALCWDGDANKPFVFAATSGSTGKPFYFPHGPALTFEYSILADLFLEQKRVDGPVLVIITFGMGVWIGGIFTFQAFETASNRGQDVSILTPGVNKPEILHALRELAPNFKQTIVIGYPPFVKDVLDDAQIEGIDLKRLNLRLMFAAEAFTERFRDHVVSMAHIANPYVDTLNIYGTADIGAMAWETPTSILVRRLALQKESFFAGIFGQTGKTPTMAQFNPHFINFEAPDGQILLTGNNAMPLIRYAVGDRGGVADFDDIAQEADSNSIDIQNEAKKVDAPVYQLPFVYVYERADLSTKLYGAIIYPEHVRDALQEEPLLKEVTGKFTMQTLADAAHDQYLEVNVELREHCRASETLKEALQQTIVRHLLAKNSEYHNNYSNMKERVIPTVILWPHEDPKYFKPTIKQKWVIPSK